MISPAQWICALVAGVCATAAAAAARQPALHMVAVAIVCLAMVLVAIAEHRRMMRAGASADAIAGSTARYLGLVWAWAAFALAATYLIIVERHWPEWWQFCLGFAFAAVLSIAFAAMLGHDTSGGDSDDTLVRAGRVLVKVQIAGMVAGIVSLFVDGKFPRAATHPDWAGSNIFFFGALAIALISLDALRSPAPAKA